MSEWQPIRDGAEGWNADPFDGRPCHWMDACGRMGGGSQQPMGMGPRRLRHLLGSAIMVEPNRLKDPRDVILDLVEGGLLLLLDAVKAGDPPDEIIFRIQEELRQVRRRPS